MTTSMVAVNGINFQCRVDGENSQAPWIVFSNSIGTEFGIWDAQVTALGNDYRILRYNQRGHGESSAPPGPYNFDMLGDDVAALLDHFEIPACTFVGLSMGAPTAFRLYSQHPARVERLVICDGQAATAPGGAAQWQARVDVARSRGMGLIADETISRWFSADFVASGSADKVRQMLASTPLEGFVSCVNALQNYAFAAVLPKIAVPTLLLVGARDGKMPVAMAAMRELIGGAALVEIPDAGHIPNVEQPAAFNQALIAFLRTTSTRKISTF